MDPIKFSRITEKVHNKVHEEDDKIVATWKQPKTGEITLNDAFFNWDLMEELKEMSMKSKSRDKDKYEGMFKNEN